jgi:aldehyde dehydrogenase family 7 protein A1
LTCFIQGGKILFGGSAIESEGNFVQPTIVEITPSAPVVKEELFGPVLYVMKFQVAYSFFVFFLPVLISVIGNHCVKYSRGLCFVQTLKEAIEINNSVPQGLSSSIFTKRPDIIFKWLG